MFDRTAIYTYEDGTPISGVPPILPDTPTFAEKMASMQLWHAYENKVRDVANAAFAKAFKKALK